MLSRPRFWRWPTLIIANAVSLCVLGFYQTSHAQPEQRDNQPFANAVAQRMEMIGLLKEISAQLKQQNELLRSGKLRVIASDR